MLVRIRQGFARVKKMKARTSWHEPSFQLILFSQFLRYLLAELLALLASLLA